MCDENVNFSTLTTRVLKTIILQHPTVKHNDVGSIFNIIMWFEDTEENNKSFLILKIRNDLFLIFTKTIAIIPILRYNALV